MQEEWRPCRELGGLLEVSNLGRVRSVTRLVDVPARTRMGRLQPPFQFEKPGRILSQCVGKNGYYEVAHRVGGKRMKYRTHRLVARAFVPGFFEDAHVDHLDGNKLNNRADNLEWVTMKENTQRQWANGLVDLRGSAHPGSKLTREQAAAVKLLAENGFPGALIGEWFGIKRDTVYAIKHGERWSETLKEKRDGDG